MDRALQLKKLLNGKATNDSGGALDRIIELSNFFKDVSNQAEFVQVAQAIVEYVNDVAVMNPEKCLPVYWPVLANQWRQNGTFSDIRLSIGLDQKVWSSIVGASNSLCSPVIVGRGSQIATGFRRGEL